MSEEKEFTASVDSENAQDKPTDQPGDEAQAEDQGQESSTAEGSTGGASGGGGEPSDAEKNGTDVGQQNQGAKISSSKVPQPEQSPDAPAESAKGEPLNELTQVREEMKQTLDKYVRMHAEFENYKKRVAKEHSESLKYAQAPVLKDMIGIMDNLERAVDHAKSSSGNNDESLLSGIEMVIKQVETTFDKFGLKRLQATGKPFDPTMHEAMSVVETNDVAENHVIEEFQAGYILSDRVVRPAMVSVAKAKPVEEQATPSEGDKA